MMGILYVQCATIPITCSRGPKPIVLLSLFPYLGNKNMPFGTAKAVPFIDGLLQCQVFVFSFIIIIIVKNTLTKFAQLTQDVTSLALCDFRLGV